MTLPPTEWQMMERWQARAQLAEEQILAIAEKLGLKEDLPGNLTAQIIDKIGELQKK